MYLFMILNQIIYRGRRFGGASVGTATPNEDAVPTPPNEGVGAPADVYLRATGGDALMPAIFTANLWNTTKE
jgi:hypothetical protein